MPRRGLSLFPKLTQATLQPKTLEQAALMPYLVAAAAFLSGKIDDAHDLIDIRAALLHFVRLRRARKISDAKWIDETQRVFDDVNVSNNESQ